MGRTLLRAFAFTAVAMGLMACGPDTDSPSPTPDEETDVVRPTLAEVLRIHSPSLIELPGVVAVYEGRTDDDEPCIRVGVSELDEQTRARIPEALEGWPVIVEDMGEIRPMGED